MEAASSDGCLKWEFARCPGETEPRRFPAFVVYTERGPTKVWAVGTLARQ